MSDAQTRSIPFGRPMIGNEERDAVMDVLMSPQLVQGPRNRAFEEAFAAMLGNGARATTVSSCTAGLHLAYLNAGLGPGDEVIVPAQTHVATAHAVEVTGARPIFVDSDATTGNIDVAAIGAAVSARTKAISVVHYPGRPVDMGAVMALARPRSLLVVEDCALALGASLDGVPCGLMGDVGVFSFYPAKHMTTAEGGMVVSRSADTIDAITSIKSFGYDRTPGERKVAGIYDIARLGVNYRMSELAAAIGLEQLKKVPAMQAQRKANAAALRRALGRISEITLLPDGDGRFVHSNYCIVVVLADRSATRRPAILEAMKKSGVGTSVYYPVPIPLSAYYRARYGARADQFPNASRLSAQSIALPVGPHLCDDDMQFIASAFERAMQGAQ